MSKPVLVLVGAGCIGSYMVLALVGAGYSPIVFDNFSIGFSEAVGEAALLEGNLRSQADLDACLCANRIDLVMYYAALAYVGEAVIEPEVYY